ncbi:MAG: methyl-accepting chemotaxis protein, partial [Leptolyngbyaceae cyanobacterium bins.59]|nr:methyl-accepting chemotaxis protein [Leptolyngbyaceae cyanobacterium bins.59]
LHFHQHCLQEVLKTGRPIVTLEPAANRSTRSLFLMTPVKNETNGRTIAVLRGQFVTASLEATLRDYDEQGSQYYLVGPEGRIFVTSKPDALNQAASDYFSNYTQLRSNQRTIVQPGVVLPEKSQQVIGYSPVPATKDLTRQPWDVVLTTDKATSLLPQQKLQVVLGGGAILSILVMGALAALMAGRVTRPILAAAQVVESLGQGDLDSRIEVEGNDEIAKLGANINLMADQIQTLLQEQKVEAERVQLLSNLTLRIREVLQPEVIVETAVQEIQQALGFDRVAVYALDPDSTGIQVIAEAFGARGRSILGTRLTDPAILELYQSPLQFGSTSIVPDIYREGLSEACMRVLHSLAVWAELVAPIQVGSQVFGLLVAHQCSEPYFWQTPEVSIFSQLATQIGLALDQASLLDQLDKARQQAESSSREQQEQKERLQMQLVELLTNIEEASRGDLTVRADVTVGEIGTVADFFNAIIESSRQIVTQVKKAAAQVNVSIGQNEGAIRQLADEALLQAEEITRTLDSVEQMAHSVQAVADNARRAAEVAREASHTAEVGGAAMDRTVESILNLRETVAETAKKVKRLGESSQQISRVVSIINQIALQTNLLAINASIEAARAGEEGRGFAVVAEEVGQLAAQSAAATREIEQIVETIQRETGEVVNAMELGTAQVVEGTRLVEAAKTSLGQILDVSREIDRLVQSISSATVSQAQTSETVAMVMKAIAQVSERTSFSSRQVSSALQETVTVARQLQDSVGVFKVGV